MWTCRFCNNEFDLERATDKANHAKHCDANPNKHKQYKNIQIALQEKADRELGEFVKFDVTCYNCEAEFQVEEREKQFPLKEKYFCTRTCANSTGGKAKAAIHHPDAVASYQAVCFRYHEKECVVCEEKNIVAVHHYNENHDDNRPENLVPLCPTHHMYMHSRYKYLIEDQVEEYVKSFNLMGA